MQKQTLVMLDICINNITLLLAKYIVCRSERIRTSNVYPVGTNLQSVTTPPSSLRSYALYMFYVEAKGIEPLLEEPKSSVLPLDDASKK